MSNIKDKLSASVRRVKAEQAKAAPVGEKTEPQKTARPSRNSAARPEKGKAGEAAKVAQSRVNPVTPSGYAVPERDDSLFPRRVWPD